MRHFATPILLAVVMLCAVVVPARADTVPVISHDDILQAWDRYSVTETPSALPPRVASRVDTPRARLSSDSVVGFSNPLIHEIVRLINADDLIGAWRASGELQGREVGATLRQSILKNVATKVNFLLRQNDFAGAVYLLDQFRAAGCPDSSLLSIHSQLTSAMSDIRDNAILLERFVASAVKSLDIAFAARDFERCQVEISFIRFLQPDNDVVPQYEFAMKESR